MELHWESRAHDKDDDDDDDGTDIVELKQSNQATCQPRYLTAHLVYCPEQVIEVHKNDGVPHGGVGAVERVGLSLAEQVRQSQV